MKRICLLLLVVCYQAFPQETPGPEKAIERYTNQIKSDPNSAATLLIYMQRGLAYFQNGDYTSAITDLNRSIDRGIDPRYVPQAAYYCALSHEKLGQITQAGSSYTKVLTTLNQDETIEGRISWDQVLRKRIEIRKQQKLPFAVLNDLKTYRAFNRSDASVQNQIDSIFNSDPIYSALSHNAFTLYQSESRRLFSSSEAFQHGEYEKAIEITSTAEAGRDPVFLAIRGYVRMASGDYSQAKTDFKNAVTQLSDFNYRGLSNFFLAFCDAKTGDLQAAIVDISLAGRMFTSEQSLIPTSYIYAARARWNEETGRMAEAYKDYRELAQIKPEDGEVQAKLRELSQYKDESDQKLDALAVVRPKTIETSNNPVSDQGKTAVPTGNATDSGLSEAEKIILRYSQQIQGNSSNGTLFLQRGIAYFQAGQFSNAIPDFTTAIKYIDPGYKNQALYYRALSYHKLGEISNAIGDISAVLDVVPAGNTPIVGSTTSKDLLLTRASWRMGSGKPMAGFIDLAAYRQVDAGNANVNSTYDSLMASDPVVQFAQYDVYKYLGGDISKSVDKARFFYRNGDLEMSEDVLRRDLSKSAAPGSPVNLVLGYTTILNRSFNQAIVHLNNFLKGDISFQHRAVAEFYLGFAWARENKIDEAINAYTSSLKVFTSEGSLIPASAVLLARAALFEKQGFNEMAYNDYSQYLQLKPGDSSVRLRQQQMKPTAAITQPETKPQVPLATEAKAEEKKEVNPLVELFKNEKRYALVIGNADYPKEIGALVNPIHDAKDMAEELRKADFEVTLLLNATYRQIEVAAGNFYRTLSEGPKDQTVGLFYYSGHGLQYEGQNLIVPVDAVAISPTDIPYVCNKVDKVLGRMEAASTRMNIMILDACRSNPFPVADRSFSAGLAQVRPARGSYVAFATAPGSTASDGVGRNGLYTQELLKAMATPNVTIEHVFKEVRKNVLEISGGKQSTWDNSNIIGDFYFRIKE